MKKLILFFLKPLSFLPAICMMYVIYSFSAQSGAIIIRATSDIDKQL